MKYIFLILYITTGAPTYVSELFFVSKNPTYIKVDKNTGTKTKFYNFDDLLIKGAYKKPQVLYTDARQKVKFEKLLKLKKSFIPKLKSTNKDPSLR